MSIKSSKLTVLIDFSNCSKSIRSLTSFQTNSLLLIDAVTELIPQSLTPLIIKGITVVFNL